MLWVSYLIGVAAYASVATSVALNSRQIQWPTLPNNLTEDVLQVAGAISPPCAANTTWCQLYQTPGAGVYCAICMSSPSDNQTTADQMQAATAGHNGTTFHVACNAYEQLINGTAVVTSTSSSTSPATSETSTPTAVSSNSGDNKVPIGPIVGGVVGGVVGLALVVGIIYLLAIVLKKNDRTSEVRPSNVSYLSSEHKSPNLYAAPYPQLPASYPGPAPGHISPLISKLRYPLTPRDRGSKHICLPIASVAVSSRFGRIWNFRTLSFGDPISSFINSQALFVGPPHLYRYTISDMTKIDYSLYLVTAREFLPPGKVSIWDYYESLEESIQGGVTVVQVREKKSDTGEFIEIARRTKQICDKYNVPMFVNDRVDVALAVGATGVHIGQTDMPVSTARNNVDEAKRAVLDGADYVGIGAVWATATKDLVKPVLGVRGLGDMLDIVGDAGIPAVAIGGIKVHNALHTLHGAVGPITGTALSGLAIATEIISAPDASIPAKALTQIINSRSRHFHWPALCLPANTSPSAALLAENAGSLLTALREHSPLIHQITNNVVIAQSANATLALGASPIMATAPEEMEDLSKVAGGLLINFGTITNKAGMLIAGKAANANKKPVVFDPVGVGATQFRRETASELLNSWQASVIKGNAGEIGALLGSSEVIARGVDSVGPGFSDPANIVRALAKRERCIVVMTGKTDYVSDGYSAVALSNGHSMLEDITGSGCIVGTAIAAFAAASRLIAAENTEDEGKLVRGDMFQAAVAGVLAITIASEIAAARPDVKGTGTFMSALIDELYNLKPQNIADRAMVEIL
ncbi:Hydroxyethylthiazole kinase family domain-containing [Rhizoctonia solani AG-1 IA]|uniref:Hydroxyethylthiazole kinase family domain-containing n=1 Tax=Thanatephorus cucumeris (strain AG1-IA) TaxID=983506 RepID=L8X8U8_THACA|nr:Hydroxyethylthiazole kinase family domain-containing [Rhizoctonia solani AG-1 IA]